VPHGALVIAAEPQLPPVRIAGLAPRGGTGGHDAVGHHGRGARRGSAGAGGQRGSVRRDDLRRWGIELADGLRLVLYTEDADAEGRIDDLVTVGTVRYDDDEGRWAAEIDWERLVHVSELPSDEAQRYRDGRPGPGR